MKKIKFKITEYKNIPITDIKNSPFHSHNLMNVKNSKVIYEFTPSSTLNVEKYSNYLIKYLTVKLTTNTTKVNVEVL